MKIGNKEITFEEKDGLVQAKVTNENGNVTEYYAQIGQLMIWYGGTLQRSREEVAEAYGKYRDELKFAQLKAAFEKK